MSETKTLGTKIIVLAIVATMVFAVAVLGGCGTGDPNSGQIRGFNGEFTAHFDRGVFFGDSTTKLINTRAEMLKWLGEMQENQPKDDLFPEYTDAFFESKQLLFVSFWGSILDYEVRSVSYANNTLTVEFVTSTRPRTIIDLGVMHSAILEISRISSDITVAFSHRRR